MSYKAAQSGAHPYQDYIDNSKCPECDLVGSLIAEETTLYGQKTSFLFMCPKCRHLFTTTKKTWGLTSETKAARIPRKIRANRERYIAVMSGNKEE